MIIHHLVGDLAFGWPPPSNILFMGSLNMLIQRVSLQDNQNSAHGGKDRDGETCALLASGTSWIHLFGVAGHLPSPHFRLALLRGEGIEQLWFRGAAASHRLLAWLPHHPSSLPQQACPSPAFYSLAIFGRAGEQKRGPPPARR